MFFLLSFLLAFLFFKKKLFTFGQVKGKARHGRSRHQSFRVCKVNLATLKVAMNYPCWKGCNNEERDVMGDEQMRKIKGKWQNGCAQELVGQWIAVC